MTDAQLTQKQLAEKYNIDEGSVSLALSAAGIFRMGKCKVYPERAAVEALIGLFKLREKRSQDAADHWKAKAEKTEAIFEEGKT